MRIIEHKFNKISLYSEAAEMPINRYVEHNRVLMLEAGIGSDLDATMKRINMAALKMDTDTDAAKRELNNLAANIHLITSGVNLKANSWAYWIESINGVPNNDLSTEGISNLLIKIDKLGIPMQIIESAISEIKKK